MEIYVQFRSTLFSYGAKGFRRMNTWDWEELQSKFDLLFDKQHTEVQRVYESRDEAEKAMRLESKKQLIMKNQGAWQSFNDNTLPFEEEDGK